MKFKKKDMVNIGDLRQVLKGNVELTNTLALVPRITLNKTVDLGDYASVVVISGEAEVKEMVIAKAELKRFAEECKKAL